MEGLNANAETWKKSNIQVFWGEIAACEHTLQMYENEKVLINTLEGFAGSGLLADDSGIIIATQAHLQALESRLSLQGFDLEKLKLENRFISLEASHCLEIFMRGGWPDEHLFYEFVKKIIQKARCNQRGVRAFGEMVAVLWEQGLRSATVQLEQLWCRLQEEESLSLYCAYPKSGFTQEMVESMKNICAAHNKVIAGEGGPATEIYYRAST